MVWVAEQYLGIPGRRLNDLSLSHVLIVELYDYQIAVLY